MKLKVLDLFAGLKGWSQPFKDRGHDTYTIDWDKRFDVDLHANILEPLTLPWRPDVVLASPPCEGFSVMQIGRNWTEEHQPKTEKARLSVKLVERTLEIIRDNAPVVWVMENPRAKLRKLPVVQNHERRTVAYCQYGERRMKPTDLWGGFPPSFSVKPMCSFGDPCHNAAPRGSRTGTQGMDRAESAKIPYALALDICIACERDIT